MARIAVEELRLNGANIDLQPSKDWRALAKTGRRSMHYKIFARAKLENGQEVGVDLRVGALDADREIADLGDGSVPVIAGLLAKNDPNIDSLKLRYRADGSPETAEDGSPVYAEGPLMQDDGSEFPNRFGTLYFATLHGGIRLTAANAVLEPTGRTAAGSGEGTQIPVYRCECAALHAEKAAVAGGGKLFGAVKIGGKMFGAVKIGVTGGSKDRQAARARGTAAEAAALVM